LSTSTTSTSTAIQPLTVREAAEQRRSIRAYTPEPIPRADLVEILRQTGLAPSAWNLQPWRFVVVETPQLKDKLQAAAYGQPQVGAAQAVFVLYTDMAETLETIDEIVRPDTRTEARAGFRDRVGGAFAAQSVEEREAWAAVQGNIALGFLLLTAQGLGYSTSAMAGFEPEKVRQLLGLPAHVRVNALIAIGRPAEDGLPHYRHPVNRIARFA
jgi:nitroreductase